MRGEGIVGSLASAKRTRKGMTAAELMDGLNADPEYQRKEAERDAEIEQRAQILREAEQPIVEDLRRVGQEVSSVWDLVNTSIPYPDALPVLLAHLSRGGYPDRVMESLGMALAVRPASFAWQTLRDLYLHAEGLGEEEGLAVTLAVSATAEQVGSLVGLLGEASRGQSRIHFLRTIKRLGGEHGVEVLESLRGDPCSAKRPRPCSWFVVEADVSIPRSVVPNCRYRAGR